MTETGQTEDKSISEGFKNVKKREQNQFEFSKIC